MRIIITGGGTGGHIYPAIAVASEILKNRSDAEILFIGTKRGLESKAVPAAGFPIRHIVAAGFSSNPVNMLKFPFVNTAGILQAFSAIMEKGADFIIASGGFVSAPVLFCANLLKIPYILLEQNVLPGKVNRLMAKKATCILTSFESSVKYLPRQKTVFTGNPVRSEILKRTRREGAEILKLNPEKFTILITGASQGAKSINSAILKSLPQWKNEDWQIIHLVGRKNYDDFKEKVSPLLKDFKGKYRLLDYSEDMASLYSVTDLAIARAGASTLAELTALGIPSILIPYPYAADNHQEKNARWIEESGGAQVILDNEVEEKLAREVYSLAKNNEKLAIMKENSKNLGRPDALKKIIEEIEKATGFSIKAS